MLSANLSKGYIMKRMEFAIINREGTERVNGYHMFDYHGNPIACHKLGNGYWKASDVNTGHGVSGMHYSTRKDALKDVSTRMESFGYAKYWKAVKHVFSV